MENENPTKEQEVLFEQFKISVHCLTLSKAQLQEQIAYIRLKQRLKVWKAKRNKIGIILE